MHALDRASGGAGQPTEVMEIFLSSTAERRVTPRVVVEGRISVTFDR